MAPHEPPRRRQSGLLLAFALATCVLALPGCGDTVQDQPIPHNTLEGLLVAPYPVYWLGRSFRGLSITEVTHDPGGAFSLQYGDCIEGGQGTCVPALRVVTSADNSFLPGSSAPHRILGLRGVPAQLAWGGRAIAIPTAGLVLSIYARDERLALAAAETAVPINDVGVPGARLPPPVPDTGYALKPLPSQLPPLLQAPR